MLNKKKCIVCKKIKPFGEYHRQNERKDGRNSTCKKCRLDKQREKRRTFEGKLVTQRYAFKRNFGITLDDYWDLMKAQDGVCAVCGQPETKISRGALCRLSVDHNHQSNVIRGLLCHGCNAGIGLLKEDVEVLKKAIEYLEKYAKD